MLSVTDRAAIALSQNLVKHGLDDTHGHRILRLPGEEVTYLQFRVETVTAPALNDTIIACGRTHVFVAPDAVEHLSNAVLDVNDDPGGAWLVLRRARR